MGKVLSAWELGASRQPSAVSQTFPETKDKVGADPSGAMMSRQYFKERVLLPQAAWEAEVSKLRN
jgi:hypothetical protein